jgi:hypothetical protein
MQAVTRAVVPIGLFCLGLVVNMHFAGMAYMPLDQSIVFDGGWRLLSGQVPFRDFATPNAVVPSLMQVPFFGIFGITWFSYCLHASIVNGLFSVVAFALLRLCSATRAEAALFAALAAFLFYPPVGAPYMDQHAFFFGLLAMLAAVTGSVSVNRSTVRIAWALVPWSLALGYLSKQIPTAFIGVCIGAWVVLHPRQAKAWVASAAVGTLAGILVLVVIHGLAPFDASQAWQYLVRMPLAVGAQRGAGRGTFASVRLVSGTLRRLPSITGLWSVWIPASAICVVPFVGRSMRDARLLLWTCATTVLVTGAFVAFTVNQPQDGVGLVLIGAAAGLCAWRQAIAVALRAQPDAVRRLAIGALTVAVATVSARDTIVFVREIDDTRAVLDLQFDPVAASRGHSFLPPSLSYLEWTNDRYDAAEFSGLIAFLAEQDGNFVLIGDSSIIYGLTRRPSIAPVLWFDPGLSMPRLDTPEFDRLESDLLQRMRDQNVRFVVDEGSTRGMTLASFPRLAALTARHQCREEHFGKTRVFELCQRE